MVGRVGAGLDGRNKNLTANAALTLPRSLDPRDVKIEAGRGGNRHTKVRRQNDAITFRWVWLRPQVEGVEREREMRIAS